MTHVEEHIKDLLEDQGWNDRQGVFYTIFWRELFTVRHHKEELEIRYNDALISSVPLQDYASLRDVHLALQYLFTALPKYTVWLRGEIT